MAQESRDGDRKKESSGPDSAVTAYAIYGAAGIQLAISVVVCLIFGNYLDKKLGTLPWLTLVGIILGFIGGMLNLVRILGWFNKKRGS